jgi:hypothetical protein
VLTCEEKLKRAAMSFGAWREKANTSKTTADRIRFVHAENALGQAAQAFFEKMVKETPRVKRRGKKS